MIKLEWIEMNPLKASNWTTKATEFDKLAHAEGSALAAMILSPIFGLVPGCLLALLGGALVELIQDRGVKIIREVFETKETKRKAFGATTGQIQFIINPSVTDLAANFAGVLSFFLSVEILLLRGG